MFHRTFKGVTVPVDSEAKLVKKSEAPESRIQVRRKWRISCFNKWRKWGKVLVGKVEKVEKVLVGKVERVEKVLVGKVEKVEKVEKVGKLNESFGRCCGAATSWPFIGKHKERC